MAVPDPQTIQIAARDAWEALRGSKDPLRTWDNCADYVKNPMLDSVRANFMFGFDCEKVVPYITKNKATMQSLYEAPAQFHRELSQYLHKWAVKRGLAN